MSTPSPKFAEKFAELISGKKRPLLEAVQTAIELEKGTVTGGITFNDETEEAINRQAEIVAIKSLSNEIAMLREEYFVTVVGGGVFIAQRTIDPGSRRPC